MRHGIHKAQLNRTASHRRALFSSLASALIKERQIQTTTAKAKAVRPFVERMVSFAKKGDLASRRHVARFLRQKSVVKELFEHVGPFYAQRNGGYTRIMKLGVRRGDAAPLAILEFVDREGMGGKKEESKKEAAAKSRKAPKKAAETSSAERAK